VGYGITDRDRLPLLLHGSPIAHVAEFRYLGSMVTPNGRSATDIRRRLACASRAFGSLHKSVFCDRSLSIRTKRLLYTACVLSVLLYGAESWTPLQADLVRLDRFHHHCVAAILGLSRKSRREQHLSNVALRHRWGDTTTVSQMVTCRRFEWLGHLARMPTSRLPLRVFCSWFQKTRPFCGPRRRWKDLLRDDMQKWKMPVTPTTWVDLAQERPKWLEMYKTAITEPPAAERSTANDISCDECHRLFRSRAGFKRHKCLQERRKPISEQAGAVQCSTCGRWFASAGGLAVHHCSSVASTRMGSLPHSEAPSDRGSANYRCSECGRVCKSHAGLQRHNCHRGHRPVDRSSFQFSCDACDRRFRRPQDRARHKCRPSAVS